MTRTICRPFNMQACGVVIIAIGMFAPIAWSQETNQFNPDAPRAERNNQRGAADYERRETYSDRGYDQSDYQERDRDGQYDRRGQDRRDYQADTPNRARGNQYDDRVQSNQRSQQGDERNRPAGLGVMLDTSQGNVEVRQVARNSPADRAGIQRGDEILSINGQRVDSTQQVAQLVRREQPGSQIDIRIRRDDQQRTLTAELESLEQALDNLERARQRQWQQEDEYALNSPPWDDDQVMRHVDHLEQQVRRMQQEIDDLRAMLDSDPSGQRFSQRNQREQSQFRD